jgi:hypothetical protein
MSPTLRQLNCKLSQCDFEYYLKGGPRRCVNTAAALTNDMRLETHEEWLIDCYHGTTENVPWRVVRPAARYGGVSVIFIIAAGDGMAIR